MEIETVADLAARIQTEKPHTMKLAFFHNSNEYRTEFTSKIQDRPTFYWFSDRFHDHYGYGRDGSYLHLFVKDPVTSHISVRARAGTRRDFHDLYSHFLIYKNKQIPQVQSGEQTYAEPPILMSFDKVSPDLIAVYHKKSNEYEVLYPASNGGVRFQLYEPPVESNWSLGTPFTEVPELVNAVPELSIALPFQEPERIDDTYVYDRWVPMVSKRNGTWL